jgi:diguanylate cyclase (GGDEF)-like protein/PAS domain S-box-containing protein
VTFAWTAYSLVPGLAAVLSVVESVYVWRRRALPGAAAFAWLLWAGGLWAAASALEKAGNGLPTKLIFAKIQYIGIGAVPPLWLAFALSYCRADSWLTPLVRRLLWVVPTVTLVIAATNEYHGWLWSSITPSSVAPDRLLIFGHGPWFFVQAAYIYLLILIGSIALVWSIFRYPQLYGRPAAVLLAGVALPWVANGVYLAGANPLPGVDPTPVAFSLTGLLYAWTIFRWRLLDLLPLAREFVLEHMQDGVIVVNASGHIVDVNHAGERITGQPAQALVGRLASEMWPEAYTRLGPSSETPAQVELTAHVDGNSRYFDVRVTPLRDDFALLGGWAVVLRDITDRRRGEQQLTAANANLGAAMERVNEFARLAEVRAQEAETLREAAAVVAGSLNPSDAIERIMAQVARVIPCDAAWIQVRRGDLTEVVGGRGVSQIAAALGARFPIESKRASGIVYRERKTLILNDVPSSGLIAFDDTRFEYVRSWMGVPLIMHDAVVGLLTLGSQETAHFTQHHRDLAEAFAAQAVIALENARLYNEAQRMAITDGLTGLFNRRHFFERAEAEFVRARRYHHALSVIMLDVDLFKQVNDAHGHAVGDRALRRIADELRQQLRSIDLLGRYGGEEFAVLLPETDCQNAWRAAERLRASVEALPISVGDTPVRVTISLGVAEADESCRTLDLLLERSDQALYAAKNGGRNRVRLWPPESDGA